MLKDSWVKVSDNGSFLSKDFGTGALIGSTNGNFYLFGCKGSQECMPNLAIS